MASDTELLRLIKGYAERLLEVTHKVNTTEAALGSLVHAICSQPTVNVAQLREDFLDHAALIWEPAKDEMPASVRTILTLMEAGSKRQSKRQ